MPAGSPRFVFEKPHLFSAPGVKPGRAVLPAHPHPETPFPLLTDPDSAGPAHPAGGPWHTDSQSPAEISRIVIPAFGFPRNSASAVENLSQKSKALPLPMGRAGPCFARLRFKPGA